MNLGLAVLLQRRPDEALRCQRTALRLDPDSADAQNNLGMVHYAKGHIAEAENCFRAALRLRPDHANCDAEPGLDPADSEPCRGSGGVVPPRRWRWVPIRRGRESNLALALMEQVRPEEAELLLREALAAAARTTPRLGPTWRWRC